MYRRIAIVLMCICSINSMLCNESRPNRVEIDSFLQDVVRSYNIPALSVSIVDSKSIINSFNWGNTDNGLPITSDIPFFLGSTSKTFTALGVMRLVEQGKIRLDDPVKKYLPDFKIENKKYETQITIRHLLNHTSGLSGKDIRGTSMGLNNLEEEMELLKTCNPVNTPGTHYEYFNSNYRLLGLLIERVSGTSFQNFIYREVFNPLGMSKTSAGLIAGIDPVGGHGQILGQPIKSKQIFRKGAVPSGYIISTTGDVSKFLIEQLKANNGDCSVLNKETIRKTWKPSDNSNGYALGWLAITDSIGNKFYIHGGALEGYQSFFYINPDKDIGFVILINQGGLFPMMSFSVIRDGLISIINGEQPNLGMGKLPVILTIIVLLLVCFFYGYRVIRLRQKPKFNLFRKLNLIFDLALVIFLIVGFIPLMNRLMGDQADWSMLWNMLPEFCLLLAIICIGNIICASIKIKQFSNKTH